MASIRSGKTVANVGEYEGRAYTIRTESYNSINAAKKANGLNASTLQRGESFPPTKAEINAALAAKVA